jgi:hypothetical protein
MTDFSIPSNKIPQTIKVINSFLVKLANTNAYKNKDRRVFLQSSIAFDVMLFL